MVAEILHSNGMFSARSDGETINAKSVVIAAGGKASSNMGSDGSGYDLLKSLGHSITELSPAIVPVKTDTAWVRQLKGIKCDAVLSVEGKSKFFTGELLFTEYGISGPPVLDLSRHLDKAHTKIQADLLPDIPEKDLFCILLGRRELISPVRSLDFLLGVLNKRLGEVVIKRSGVNIDKPSDKLSENDINLIVSSIKHFGFADAAPHSFSSAQVTAGGVRADEFDFSTMKSKLVNGLFACGEVLDIDGDCGGFNLQWAWSSGFIAGKSAALTGGVH